MIIIGMVVAVLIIACDVQLERRKSAFRMPVLAVAIGIYLPFELGVPIFVGGLISAFVRRKLNRTGKNVSPEKLKAVEQRGMLISSGLITGEALVGILMAIPIVISGRSDVLAFLGVQNLQLPAILLLAVLLYVMYRVSAPDLRPRS
jgi:uncharacterized oligopeptide transporter (OPT) family protein